MTLQQTIPYVFVYTPKYRHFAIILKHCMKQYPWLEDKSIEISQEEWDAQSNKAPGHFLTGCPIKLQVTLKALETLPDNTYFLFSDADVCLFPGKPLRDLLDLYMKLDADIVFMRETLNMEFSNVGFSLIRVNETNRTLFRKALSMFQTEPAGLDGSFINECLKTYSGSHYWFPPELVATTCTVKDMDKNGPRMNLMRSKLLVFQALCDAHMPYEYIVKQKLEQYKILGILVKDSLQTISPLG